jgi:hypothetical protein
VRRPSNDNTILRIASSAGHWRCALEVLLENPVRLSGREPELLRGLHRLTCSGVKPTVGQAAMICVMWSRK